MAHVVATNYRLWRYLGSRSDRYSDLAIYVHKVNSAKLVGQRGSLGDGSENPDVRISYDWRSARFFINNVSPLNCREAEQFYLSDAELHAYHDIRSATSGTVGASPSQQSGQPFTGL